MSDPTVWIIVHSFYDGSEVRAVYATKEAAQRDLVTRTKSGKRSRAYYAHDENCCEIEEWEVCE